MNKKLTTFLVLSVIFCFATARAEFFQFNKDLYFGIKGDAEVTNLQQFLTDKGFYSGPITGNFFSLTREAVKKYQATNGIEPVSGYFGPKTRTLTNKMVTSIVDLRLFLEKQIAEMEKQLMDLQNQLVAAQNTEQQQQVSTTTPAATSTPEVLLSNPFNSTLKIESVYPSLTLSGYKDVVLNVVSLTTQEKIAVTKIRFTNTGTLRDDYLIGLKIVDHDTNIVIASVSNVVQGVLEFVMTADNSKIDKGLMVSGKTYDIIGTILTPNAGEGYKPYAQLDISSSTDVSAFDYNNLTRVAKITGNNTFPISGPKISTF